MKFRIPRYLFVAALPAALLPLALGCPRRQDPPPPPPAVQAVKEGLEPWTWHRLGGLLVVQGEVDGPVDLRLKGRYLNERRHAEFGPVRWEMYAPPPGEVAELRSAEGKLLAHWDFSASRNKPGAVVAAKPMQAKAKPLPKGAAPSAPMNAGKTAPNTVEKNFSLAMGKTPPKDVLKVAAIPSPLMDIQPHFFPPPPPPSPLAPVLELPVLPPAQTPGWPGAGEAFNLLRGPKGSHQICLTFDGGSSNEVALDVLDTLKVRRIRTTFFLTGAFIVKFPDIVRRMAQDGHEIGNHTLNHPHFAPNFRRDPKWTKLRFQQELLQADAALLKLLGRPMDPYWRAPYGEQTSELRSWGEELGYRHVGWSEGADTLDWATSRERKLYRTGDAILDRLRDRMERRDGEGLIVLMHLGSGRPEADRPAKVLPPFIDHALSKGWRFVNIGAYMQASGKPRWEPSHRLALLEPNAAALRTASKR